MTRKAEPIQRNPEPIRQNIRFRNTKCIQSDRNILGLSVQGLVSHIIMAGTDCYSCTSFANFIYMVIYTNPSLVNRLFVILSTPTPVRGNEPGCVATQTPFQANFTLCNIQQCQCSTITWLYQYSPDPSCQVEGSVVQTRLWWMIRRVCHSTVKANLGLRKRVGVLCTSHCIFTSWPCVKRLPGWS